MEVGLRFCVEFGDHFTSLSTQRNSIDRYILGDISSLRYEFQTSAVEKISGIPGKGILVDPLTNKYSPLEDTLQMN